MLEVRCRKTDQFIERQTIEERVIAYDVYTLAKDIRSNEFKSLFLFLTTGFKGYENFTDEELLEAYTAIEDGFYAMAETDNLPYRLHYRDPIRGGDC